MGNAPRSNALTLHGRTFSASAVRVAPIAGPLLELAEAAAQGLDFVLVSVLLPLGQFQELQHLFHIVERFPQTDDDVVDLIDGLLNGIGRGGAIFPGGRRGRGGGLSPRLRGLGWRRNGFKFGFGILNRLNRGFFRVALEGLGLARLGLRGSRLVYFGFNRPDVRRFHLRSVILDWFG
jgi:hypothetical protein